MDMKWMRIAAAAAVTVFSAAWAMGPAPLMAQQTLRIIGPTGGAVKALTEDLIPAFQTATGVKVEGIFLPQDGLTQKAMTEFVSRAPSFDAIMFETSWGGRYAPFLDDLQPYVIKAGAAYDEADILAAARGMGIADGKTVGLPYRTLGRMLYYRKDLFQEAGLSEPPKTLPQMLEYAQKLTKGDVYGLAILGKQGFGNAYEFGSYLFSSGGTWWDRKSYEVRINDPIGVKALGFYADLRNKQKVVPPEVTTWAWDEWIAGAQNGRYAMTIMHVPYATQIEDPKLSKTAGKWGWADAPGWDSLAQGAPPVGGWLWGLPAESRQKALAWQFIAYVTGKEAQLKSALNANAPSRRSAFMSPELKAKWPWAEVALRSLDRGTPMYNNPEELEAEAALAVNVSEALLGAKTAQQAADESAAKLKQILEKAGRYKK
ncbi:MAG: sugar ABC transporter substrate-binding protein [Proteobacteria bacterium]|nr:sugar ABC transporter substrate-binding protein [Pseudomonadota bacterium]MBI3495863.1 sugar ABC transporter substrate-binding protein [Pseudomonadota bacterium]